MENTPWRLVIIAAFASFVLLLSIYVLVLPKDLTEDKPVEKIAAFKGTYAAGHTNGKKSWEFYAESGWSGKDSQITNLSNVTKGKLYKDGDLLTKNLAAPIVRAYPNSKILEAEGRDSKQVSAVIAFTQKDKKKGRKFLSVRTDKLVYSPDSKRTELIGKITASGKDIRMKASRIMIDHDKELATLSGTVEIKRKDIDLSCASLVYDSKEERLDANDKVRTIIKGKQKTYLNTNKMVLYEDKNKDVILSGSVEAKQGNKWAVAQSGMYNKETGRITLSTNVKSVISKGKGLLRSNTIGKLHNLDARKLLEEKTFITADNLTLSTKNGDAKAEGNVYVYQKGREAKSNIAGYSDKKEIITMIDNVYLKKENSWVKCRKINVSVKDETFEAIGSVEAEFKIKR